MESFIEKYPLIKDVPENIDPTWTIEWQEAWCVINNLRDRTAKVFII